VTRPVRTVRLSDDFYDDLYASLGPDRGPRGEPSREDFETTELPAILHQFATAFEGLPQRYPGNPRYRILLGAGALVFAFSVVGELGSDDVVTLLQLRLDLYPPAGSGGTGDEPSS
jgi:hypothetical protein